MKKSFGKIWNNHPIVCPSFHTPVPTPYWGKANGYAVGCVAWDLGHTDPYTVTIPLEAGAGAKRLIGTS